MEKSIKWKAPTGDSDHQIPEGATVRFEREDGNTLEIKFAEDGSIKAQAKGSAEFEHSYFLPPPEPPDWEDVASQTVGCCLYKHTMVPDCLPVDPVFDIRKNNEQDESQVATVLSKFPSEWVAEDFQQVHSPVFVIEKETGSVCLPTDPRLGTPEQPEVLAWKTKSELLFKEEIRDLAVPGTGSRRNVVRAAMKAMKILGWKYFYQLEERGDPKHTYVYARGC